MWFDFNERRMIDPTRRRVIRATREVIAINWSMRECIVAEDRRIRGKASKRYRLSIIRDMESLGSIALSIPR